MQVDWGLGVAFVGERYFARVTVADQFGDLWTADAKCAAARSVHCCRFLYFAVAIWTKPWRLSHTLKQGLRTLLGDAGWPPM